MIEEMLKQLEKSLIELEKTNKIQDQLMSTVISQLPKDKKHSLLLLFEKAKKGKIGINEILNFAGKIPDKDKKDIETILKKADDLNK